MTKHDLPFLPEFFDRYINLAGDTDLIAQLSLFDEKWLAKDLQKMKALGDTVYAEGKWTMKDILQHIIDTERIMAYRALRISRGDTTALPGFEENDFAKNTTAASRSFEDLIAEFAVVRQSTILLFQNMTPTMQLNIGTASAKPITPLALGLTLVGHPIHHLKVVEERYFVLL
jgi:DinB superfamily